MFAYGDGEFPWSDVPYYQRLHVSGHRLQGIFPGSLTAIFFFHCYAPHTL
jgi:hypothetical protein